MKRLHFPIFSIAEEKQFSPSALSKIKHRKLILTIIFLLASLYLFGQEERIVSGILKDRSGIPMPGVTIQIEGSTIGTVADVNGYYKIKVPLGSILIYNFVGYSTMRVTVTLNNSTESSETMNNGVSPKAPRMQSSYSPIPIPEQEVYCDTISSEEGTATFTEKSPSFQIIGYNNYWWDSNNDPSHINNININDHVAKISIKPDRYIHIPMITYFSSATIEMPNKLPELQDDYAQGRAVGGVVQWRGPETGETFSWGPNIKNLEFDGSVYNYDKNGQLVALGTGNGRHAKSYNPYQFLRNGTSYFNSLKIEQRDEKRDYSCMFINEITNGIIPNARKSNNSATIKLKRMWRHIKLGYNLTYSGNKNTLMNDNPSKNLLMASVLTTPVTFDNANGYNHRKAVKTPSAYLLNTSNQRSASSGNSNNPYWLSNSLPDKAKYTDINNSLEISIVPLRNLEFKFQPGFESQSSNDKFGYPQLTEGVSIHRLTDRTDKLKSYHTLAELSYAFYDYRSKINLSNSIGFDYRNSKRLLERKDTYSNIESADVLEDSYSRFETYVSHTLNFRYQDAFILRVVNGFSQNSSFVKHKLYYNPYAAAAINFNELFRNRWRVVSSLKLRGSFSKNYTDVPVVFSLGRYNYQSYTANQFMQSYFSNEVVSHFSLNPAKELKKGIGLDFGLFSNRVSGSFDYYQNNTTDAILPVAENSTIVLRNLADTRTSGVDANICFQHNLSYRWLFKLNVFFSKNNTQVTHLQNGQTEIPLGGFSDVHTSLIEGEPYGVIVGTAYQRSSNGELMIGSEGYPLVDSKLKVLGNPNPDYRIGTELIIEHKNFAFSCLFEFSKGGKVWNGTENVLSYLGMASKTAEGRNVKGYVYPGVTEDGTLNTVPVDFYNPDNDITSNRYVRYGVAGVAEEAIQDATWFRIKEICIKYTLSKRQKISAEFSLFVKNPLLITKYSGVDPQTTMWGQYNTHGLDMFNMPNLTSYGLAIKISL